MPSMRNNPLLYDDSLALPGPYDGASADPWFLPEPGPGPEALRPAPPRSRDWRAAQAGLAADLARLALLYGVLSERLRAGPKGWQHRLALIAATEISWAGGDRVSAERLALWEARHLSGAEVDAQGLARASWAFRRLLGTTPPGQDLAGFLARHGAAQEVATLTALLADLAALHPVTRAAAVAQVWQNSGDGGGDGRARRIEAAVLASRLAAEMAGQGAGHVPQAGLGTDGQGLPQAVLAAWIAGAVRGTEAALLHVDRVRAWQVRAEAGLAGLQGRTPLALVQVLAAWPLVSAAMAEALTGANRSTVQRNLAALQARGLLREVTGQGRYRLWTARL